MKKQPLLKQVEQKTGRVTRVRDGIITVTGLEDVKAGEVVWVMIGSDETPLNPHAPTVMRAIVLTLNKESVQAMLLGDERWVEEGLVVTRSCTVLKVACGLGLFGQVLDGIGKNKLGVINYALEAQARVEQKATGIVDRSPVRIPLRTGLKSVDSLVPIGRGQRELIIGDRQTGKTSIAVDAILNHVSLNSRYRFSAQARGKDLQNIVWFIYNAVGQKQSTVNQIRATLEKKNALWFTAIVAATAAEPAPLQFLAPYTACTLGEFIRDVVGGHATVIYDDLTKHAVAYRQMSLLLRRPPGREAFPGDVFYVHSRLLERAGSLTHKGKHVRGTLTAFPVIETQAGDVSAYIPTNVISITDGQIFLETELFYRGIRPAVNVGLSVSRVGSAAQPGIMKKVVGSLKMELAQYREIEGFSKLGAALDDSTQQILNRGEGLVELLKQNLHAPLTTLLEVLSLFLGVGYSGAWLQTEVLGLRVPRQRPGILYSRRRARMSWLEGLRTNLVGWGVEKINTFVEDFLNFVQTFGIVKLGLSTQVETKTLGLLKRYPLAFFDDLVVAFLLETATINWGVATFNRGRMNKRMALYSLIGGGVVKKLKRVNAKINKSFDNLILNLLVTRLRVLSLTKINYFTNKCKILLFLKSL